MASFEQDPVQKFTELNGAEKGTIARGISNLVQAIGEATGRTLALRMMLDGKLEIYDQGGELVHLKDVEKIKLVDSKIRLELTDTGVSIEIRGQGAASKDAFDPYAGLSELYLRDTAPGKEGNSLGNNRRAAEKDYDGDSLDFQGARQRRPKG